jgi:predicted CoA-binding protein
LNLAKKGVDMIVTYHSNAEEAAKVVAEIESLGAKVIALQLDTANMKTFNDFALQVKRSLLGRVGLPDDIGGAIGSNVYQHR